jgi:hypothetical protein
MLQRKKGNSEVGYHIFSQQEVLTLSGIRINYPYISQYAVGTAGGRIVDCYIIKQGSH